MSDKVLDLEEGPRAKNTYFIFFSALLFISFSCNVCIQLHNFCYNIHSSRPKRGINTALKMQYIRCYQKVIFKDMRQMFHTVYLFNI